MYLDRSYRPKRRRSKWRFLWVLVFVAVVAIILYEQQPAWLVPSNLQPTPVPTRGALSYLADAQKELGEGEYAEAIESYRQMIRLEPNDATAYTRLSELYLLLEDLEQH